MRLQTLLLSLVLLSPVALPADPARCPGAGPVVVAGDARDRDLVCEGARRALAFLAGLGLHVSRDLLVEPVEDLPPLYGVEQLGNFDAHSGRIHVLSYAQCERIGNDSLLFGQPLDPDLYRSLVAHEVAHAVFAIHYRGDAPGIASQEYLAYATQFAAMDGELRQRILDSNRTRGFGDVQEMSASRYFVDPQAFGIAAYRHFSTHPDGIGFVRRLLSGEIRTGPAAAY